MFKKADNYERITTKILAQLEKGVAPWVRPWDGSTGMARSPHNADSKRPYSGINRLVLWMEQIDHGYSSSGWLTFKRAKALGGYVRKGEKGCEVIFLARIDKKGKDGQPEKDANGNVKTRSLMRSYWVFNLAQIDNLPANIISMPATEEKPLTDPAFEAWVKATKAVVAHGVPGYEDDACYIPSVDRICMPEIKAFKSPAHYKATLLHELTHWTGAKPRLDRQLRNKFGDGAYAAEELVAELGAAFLCADLGISGDLRHADYIGHWIKLLKEDSSAIFTASSKARQASDYLHELTGKLNKPADEEVELEEAA